MCVCVRYNGQLSIIIKYTGKIDTDTKSHTDTVARTHTEARASKQKVSARCKLHGQQQQQRVGEREKLTRRRLKLY